MVMVMVVVGVNGEGGDGGCGCRSVGVGVCVGGCGHHRGGHGCGLCWGYGDDVWELEWRGEVGPPLFELVVEFCVDGGEREGSFVGCMEHKVSKYLVLYR